MSIPTSRSYIELDGKATISLFVQLCKEPKMSVAESACIAGVLQHE
jgi:hypothetical protein